MRKIKINYWNAKTPEGEEIKESIISVVSALISNKKTEELPKGIEYFRLFNRIANSFEKAEATGELIFEEKEYVFIKQMIEKDIPAMWALNINIKNAVDDFLNAIEE